MELRICVPYNSRSTAWASFDGRGRVELKQGDHIKITASQYPFPTVCADKQSTDWFHSISRTLKWNERERQKSFVMVEEAPAAKASPLKKVSTTPLNGESVNEEDENLDDQEEDEDEEEEEEKYDIDDSSNVASVASTAPPSTTHTPARSRPQSRVDLSMSSIASNILDAPSGNASEEIDLHEDGARDNIHSPKSLIHGAKSKIPKDRDVDSMKTPRAHDPQHPHKQHRHLHHTVAPSRLGHPHPSHAPHVQRRHHLHHRPSRSADFGTGNRAFAVWGQDESDSNTDSEN
jgi:NAD+ kinase